MEDLDVLGLPLEEALQILRKKGIEPLVRSTGSPVCPETKGIQRAVNLSCLDERWTLWVCFIPDTFL